jgi:hypothetical protein
MPLRQCRALAEAPARLACYDAIPLASAPVPTAPPVPPVPPEAQFGLPTPADQILAVETRYEGLFEGWRPNDRIRLANGQIWQVVDGSNGVYDLKNPKVTVRRGALGRYFLDIEGASKTPTVRRVE